MKPEIWEAAITVARRVGYQNVTRQALADQLGQNLNWVHNNCRVSEIVARLRTEAVQHGLQAGDRGLSNSGPGRNWGEEDKKRLLDCAWKIATEQGLARTTREAVAYAAEVAPSTVNARWGNIRDLRAAVVKRAQQEGNASLIAQAQGLGLIPA